MPNPGISHHRSAPALRAPHSLTKLYLTPQRKPFLLTKDRVAKFGGVVKRPFFGRVESKMGYIVNVGVCSWLYKIGWKWLEMNSIGLDPISFKKSQIELNRF